MFYVENWMFEDKEDEDLETIMLIDKAKRDKDSEIAISLLLEVVTR